MDFITNWFGSLSPAVRQQWFSTAVILVALLGLRWVALAVIGRRIKDPIEQFRWRKGSLYITVAVGLLLVGPIWVSGIQQLGAFLGIASAGIAIALKDPLTDMAGWAYILWRKPFALGDRVEISGHRGDVIDVRLFKFTLLEIGAWVDADQPTGRVVHIPNHKVFVDPQVNYGMPGQALWNELPVMVTFESNWRKAKKLLMEEVRRHSLEPSKVKGKLHQSDQYAVRRSEATPGVITTVADSGVVLTLRYLCSVNDRRGSAERVWEGVLGAFDAEPDIELAYPTVRYFRHESGIQ